MHLRVVIALALAVIMSGTSALAEPGNSLDVPATPDSVTTAGQIRLMELKKTLTFAVKSSQSRLFKTENKIIRTSVADPAIAEPVVLAENLLLLVGNKPGETTMYIWDDDGGEVGLNVIVETNKRKFVVANTPALNGDRSPAPETTDRLILTECADLRTSNGQESGAQQSTGVHAIPSIEQTVSDHPKATRSLRRTKVAVKPQEEKVYLSGDDSDQFIVGSGSKTGNTRKTIDLIVSQSRTLQTDKKIVKDVITDPAIAEPVFLSHFEVVLLGKSPGKTQFEIYDDKGVKEAFELKVDRALDPFLSHMRSFYYAVIRGIGIEKPAQGMSRLDTNTIEFSEQPTTDVIHLQRSQTKCFKLDHSMVRTSTADPEYAELALISTRMFMIEGKETGRTTVFLWDEVGNVAKLDVIVGGPDESQTRTLVHSKILPSTNSSDTPKTITGPNPGPPAPTTAPLHEVEVWTGSKKDVLSLPSGDDHEASSGR